MSDMSMESAVLVGVSFHLLVFHGVRSSERNLVFVSQVDILPRLIELGIRRNIFPLSSSFPLPLRDYSLHSSSF